MSSNASNTPAPDDDDKSACRCSECGYHHCPECGAEILLCDGCGAAGFTCPGCMAEMDVGSGASSYGPVGDTLYQWLYFPDCTVCFRMVFAREPGGDSWTTVTLVCW
jgi:hypothetical protein